jgi:hypothetical protein
LVVDVEVDDVLDDPLESAGGAVVVFSVVVFVLVDVDGPGTGTTVVVCVSLPGIIVVV